MTDLPPDPFPPAHGVTPDPEFWKGIPADSGGLVMLTSMADLWDLLLRNITAFGVLERVAPRAGGKPLPAWSELAPIDQLAFVNAALGHFQAAGTELWRIAEASADKR